MQQKTKIYANTKQLNNY